MKTKNTLKKLPDINQLWIERRRIPMALVSAIIMIFLALSGKASNVLVNPGFESNPIFASGSWSQHATVTWSMGAAAGTPAPLIHTGSDALWMQGVYNNSPQNTYAAQDFACFPGNTYTADAWYSTWVYQTTGVGGFNGTSGLFVNDGNNHDGWVEVLFYNSANILVADYKSLILTPAFEGTASGTNYTGTLPTATNSAGDIYLAWIDCPVTNQYDPTTVTPNSDPAVTGGITNTLAPGQLITAPAGAVKVEFRISDYQFKYEGGAPFWDDATLNQVGGPSPSSIADLSPDGSMFFNTNTGFSFNVISAASGGAPLPTNPTGGIGIVVNGVSETASLQFGGFPTNVSATLPDALTTNTIYTITVSVTNSVGLTSSKTVTFDTFPTNAFIVSAEDYDYTNGQFIEDPIPTDTSATNSYFGLAGVWGVDMSTYGGPGQLPMGAGELVRADGSVAMQKAADIQLPLYAAQNNPSNIYNVQIAYNNPGNWENYTRSYPTGNYFVYLRYNDDTPGHSESLNLLTSGYGTSSQTVTNLGEFVSAGIGANYAWVPLTDTFGNKVVVSLAAGTNTLQLLSGSLENFVDFIFVPVTGGLPPVINNLYPNNVNAPVNTGIFWIASNITFSVSSTFSTVATNNIQTLLNGVDVSSMATYTGYNTNWNVSLPCPQNQIMTLTINVKDATGATNEVTETFDTFSQNNMMIEAVDFDFNGGQFIDDPVPTGPYLEATNSYFDGGVNLTNQAVTNVDYSGSTNADNGEQWVYRTLDQDAGGQEINHDFIRNKFTNDVVTAYAGPGAFANDYDLGWWNAGFWENYTRTFATNKYKIYGRMAGGAGPFSGTTLSLVTSGRGTTSQTTQLLGSFADPNAAAWTTWHWVPMLDTNGNPATVSLGGVQTLRLTSGGNLNAHFIMFVPVVSSVNLSVSISGSSISLQFPTVSGHNYTVLYNNTLVGGTWQPLSAAVPGDGTVKTVPDTVTPGVPTRFYRLQIQ